MIYYEYRRKDNSIIASTLSESVEDKVFTGKKKNARELTAESTYGSVRLLVVDEDGFINSSSLSKKLLQAYTESLGAFVRYEDGAKDRWADGLKLFAHNLIEVHTQLKDTVERMFNADVQRAKGYKEQKALVKTKIDKDTDRAADDICQIAKRLDDMDAQITGFKIISGIIQNSEPNLGRYNLRNVILRHIQPFLAELQEQHVTIEFSPSEDEFEKHKAMADPKMMNVALHHFFQNATKYICPNNQICISIQPGDDRIQISIDMTSIKIEEDEQEKIFERGVSGANAGNLAGQGIGMFVIKSALEHFGAIIKIRIQPIEPITYNSKEYTQNTFIFDFPAA